MRHIGSNGTKNYWTPEDPNKPLRLTREMKAGDLIYIGGKIYFVDENRDVFEQPREDEWCIDLLSQLAVEDEMLMTSKDDIAGVGIFSLPTDDADRRHDWKYSSKSYQETHTREQADDDWEREKGKTWYAKVGRWMINIFGDALWDTTRTRWRKRKIDEGMQ